MPLNLLPRRAGRLVPVAALVLLGPVPTPALAQTSPEPWALRTQLTYNTQRHAALRSAYQGPNSLGPGADTMFTASLTPHAGWRPWAGGEVWANVEIASGVPFTGALVGLGSFTNGEITRAAGTRPQAYLQRLFLRQTWGLGGGREDLPGELNQLAGRVDRDRVTLTVGNFSTLDVFDDSAYAKDPRTQFQNWSNWTYSAYDYAADARGFGLGFALEWQQGDWSARVGRMSSPKQPNGLPVDLNLARQYGDQLEVAHRHRWGEREGQVRVLLWRNRAVLARFDDARAWLLAHPNPAGGPYAGPDALLAVRGPLRTKQGLGVAAEQALSADLGVFIRAMKADGRTETHAFTEVDASLSTGLSLKGAAWGRGADTVGLAWAENRLSADRRRFLEAGGTSFFIGDGALRYRPEQALEAYYAAQLTPTWQLALNAQRIRHPAYNADRGPVRVLGLRAHAEF